MSESNGFLGFLLKAPLRLLWAVGVGLGVLWYFLNDVPAVGFVALFVLIVALVLSVVQAGEFALELVLARSKDKALIQELGSLSGAEMGLVREFLRHDSRVLELPSSDPTVVSLHQMGFIRRASSSTFVKPSDWATGGPRFAFKLDERVWRQLKEPTKKEPTNSTRSMSTQMLKVAAGVALVLGVVMGFFSLLYAPHTLVLESSPPEASWLPWLSWIVASFSAIAYIVIDVIEHRSRKSN